MSKRDLDHLQRRLEREQQVRKQAEAENGRVALDCLSGTSPNLILLDLMLGSQELDRRRGRRPRLSLATSLFEPLPRERKQTLGYKGNRRGRAFDVE